MMLAVLRLRHAARLAAWLALACLLAWSAPCLAAATDASATPEQEPAPQHQLRQPVRAMPLAAGQDQGQEQDQAQALAQGQERQQAMTDILDIKPPQELPGDLLWLWVSLAALALLALAAGLWWWRRRRVREAAPPPSPQESAVRALDLLESRLDSPARVFYFDLSAIFRGYLEGAFGLHALEMTGEELQPRLAELPLPSELLHRAQRFVRAADPVKYAGLDAPETARRDDLDFVRSFVAAPTAQEAEHV